MFDPPQENVGQQIVNVGEAGIAKRLAYLSHACLQRQIDVGVRLLATRHAGLHVIAQPLESRQGDIGTIGPVARRETVGQQFRGQQRAQPAHVPHVLQVIGSQTPFSAGDQFQEGVTQTLQTYALQPVVELPLLVAPETEGIGVEEELLQLVSAQDGDVL